MKNALLLAILLYCISLPTQAARVINSVSLNGETTTSVKTGEIVAVIINVTTFGNGANARWKSTSYKFDDGPIICENTNDKNGSGTYTNNFDITAPTSSGSYNISFYAHKNGSCNPADPSSELEVVNGIIVSSLIAEYRFDETEYTDTPNEIVDSVGDFHGQAKNSQPIEGKVCNAIDLSATGTSNYAVLDKDILTGKTDFSVSLWAKTSKTSNQSILSGAGSNSSNELIMWFTGHTRFRPYLKGSQNGIITTSSIADDNWQHLVWTREGSQSCLFVDKTLLGCVSQTTSSLNIQSLILGQEQDSIGGSFSSSQAFDGLLDELLVFDSAITSDEIASIYDNQNSGLGYDGSARNCPILAFPSPVVDIHFDELNWDDANSIIDISGNGYHANAVNVTPTEGFICKAADLSATGINDYIILDNEALNNRSNFSISLWYKTPKAGRQSIISGSNSSQFNELIYWFTSNTRFSPWIKGGARTITTSSLSDDVWHHLVWTRSGSKNVLYRDGVLQAGSATLSTGALNITSVILGQEQDSLGGSFDASQAVEGLVDELLIFDKALNADQVLTVYDNESAGLNYDGTPRDCPTPPVAILNMQFDEGSWTGVVGEVIDETGNFNGQSKNGADTAQSTSALIGNPGTCGYGAFDGVNDYVALPASFENQQGSFTITAWIKPSNLQIGSRIFADDENNSQGYAFSLGDPGSGKLRFYSRGVRPVSVDTQLAVISKDTWTFVTAVHNLDTKTREIYVNGVAQTVVSNDGQTGVSNTYTNTWGIDTGIASIGGETNSGETANRFTGAIDEVKMYKKALSAAEINEVYQETHPCDSFIDHFEIDTRDGQGITCEADQIIIKACADASCNTVNPDAVDVKLSINGVEDKTVTVSGNNGTSTSYPYTTVGNAALSLDQTYECKGSSTPCIVEFSDASFVFSAIDDQVAGLDFSGINIRAVKDINGACTDLLSGNKSVDMALEYLAPSRSTENKYFLSGTPIAKNLLGDVNSYTAIPLNFIANSTADLGMNKYDDAGQVKLYARYVEPPSGDNSGFTIEGSSNSFWVSPHHFAISATNGSVILNGTTDSSTKKQIAGEDFTLSFIAENAGNNPTTNYIVQQAQLQLERTGPTIGGGEGNLKYSNSQSISSELNSNLAYINATEVVFDLKGEYKFNAAMYSEVGLTKLYIRENGYGSGSYKAQGITDIGRFIPHHFELSTGFDGSIISVCDIDSSSSEMAFSYSGQMSSATLNKGALQYESSLQPELLITAKTSICSDENCTTTKNYTGEFIKFSAEDVEYIIPFEDATPNKVGTLGDTIKLLANLNEGTLPEEANGIITYAFNVNDNFVYLHEQNAEISPFPSKIELGIDALEDSDGVPAIDSDGDTDNNRLWVLKPTSKEIRFGRVQLENNYGPETSNLPQPLSVNYFKDGQYVLSEDDNCTPYDSSKVKVTDISLINFSSVPPLPDITSVLGKFINATSPGETRAIELTAPGDGNRGQVCVSYDIYPWLQYKWAIDKNNLQCPFGESDVDTLYNDNPFGIATFGIYRGNDRIIYQREVSR